MTNCKLNITVKGEVDPLLAQIERASAYLDSAPDDDPIKQKMLAFGEINMDSHITLETKVNGLTAIVTATACPELQAILDMVPQE